MRYVVVGTSGSDKSTFARKLSEITRAPYIELDELHWSENWTPRPREEFEDRVRRATSGPGWVVDGNYSVIRPIVWSKATPIGDALHMRPWAGGPPITTHRYK